MVRADQGELTKVPEIATFSSLVSLGAVHDQQRAPYEAAAHRARVGRARMPCCGVWAGPARAGLDVPRLGDRRAGGVGGAGLPRHAPQCLRLCAARQGRGVRMPHGQRRSRQSIIAFRAWSRAERGGRARPLSGWYGTALSTRSPRYLAPCLPLPDAHAWRGAVRELAFDGLRSSARAPRTIRTRRAP